MEYRITDAYTTRELIQQAPREAVLHPGLTLMHVAARNAAGAFMFKRIAAENGVIDPIPFDGMPPRHMRKGILVTGQTLTIPDDAY